MKLLAKERTIFFENQKKSIVGMKVERENMCKESLEEKLMQRERERERERGRGRGGGGRTDGRTDKQFFCAFRRENWYKITIDWSIFV